MADTQPSVKKYYDFAQQQVDEQALLDKFNAATTAQFNLQREQNRQAENQFYNQMYNTQQTAMDTIRQSNAAAVSTGASRGVQAAQELSALLGLQQESVASATELANANRQTAQEETAAVLENVLNAYQQAEQQRQNLITAGIQSASVDTEAASSQSQASATNNEALQKALETSTEAYILELQRQGVDYTTYSKEGEASLDAALASISPMLSKISGATYANKLSTILPTYGLSMPELLKYVMTKKGVDTSKYSDADFNQLLNSSTAGALLASEPNAIKELYTTKNKTK